MDQTEGYTKQVKMIVEKYDNGISIYWTDLNGEADDVKIVSLESTMERGIGNMILDDIKHILDNAVADKVELDIRYKPL